MGVGPVTCRRLLHSVTVIASAFAIGGIRQASGSTCGALDSVGVGLVQSDTTVAAYLCRGYGQVFLATDTLIQSISIWRPPTPAIDALTRRLFITETYVDYEGVPNVENVILEAGDLVRRDGDGIHPVEYRWVFDPPFALPYSGKFFLDVQADEYSYWSILAATTDPYPDGEAWATGPVIDCSIPGNPRSSPPRVDLVFQVGFCPATATPTLSRTWGKLKVIYR